MAYRGTIHIAASWNSWESIHLAERLPKDRKKRIVLSGATSKCRDLLAGVPQGSILWPLIFFIYINDITDIIQKNIKLYADDATIYMDYEDPNNADTLIRPGKN